MISLLGLVVGLAAASGAAADEIGAVNTETGATHLWRPTLSP
ncbi:hypothetical protein [Nonomuraea monospora]